MKSKLETVKQKKLIIGVIALATCLAILAGKLFFLMNPPHTPKNDFEQLFSDFAIGVPSYKSLENFFRPEDGALTGDNFHTQFTQTEVQFRDLVRKFGISENAILSSNGVSLIPVKSNADPKYPWYLSIQATIIKNQLFRIQIQGVQFYN
ncbi:MAG: hypothetical protein WCJ07_03880 [Verrucomicrobiota bacterium]